MKKRLLSLSSAIVKPYNQFNHPTERTNMKSTSNVLSELEAKLDQQITTLELALNRKGAIFQVKLSNVGNPDYRQDCRRPLPETTCGWAHVDTLKEAVELCLLYISFYDLGGGNWNGGLITRTADGLTIGRVSYNGRVWADESWTPATKEICVA